MKIHLRRDATVPLYLQIKEQLQERIERGVLLPGTRLPATRTLADQLGVSRVTVVNAYGELEAEGWVQAHVGRGTFVSDPQRRDAGARDTPYDWESTLLGSAGVSAGGMLADMLHLAQHPDLISFAMGAPATDLLPVRDFREAINEVLRRDGGEALQYDEAAGYGPLRAAIARLLAEEGVHTRAADVLITSGSQQGLDLAARVFTRPGDVVITESPTYLGALDVFRSHGVTVMGVPVDEGGLRVDILEELIPSRRPRLIYTIPEFHNPTGVTLTLERRRRLLQLASRYDVPILEDSVCSELRYEGSSIPPLKALEGGEGAHRRRRASLSEGQVGPEARQASLGGRQASMEGRQAVMHLNSFSKFLLPGIRVGYMVLPGQFRERMIRGKQASDLFTCSLMQRALARYLASGRLGPHLEKVRSAYRDRRDAMLAGLARHMPQGTEWTRPDGGLCLWVTLPELLYAGQLYLTAIEHGVAFALGSVFFPHDAGHSSLRLNFAAHPPAVIDEGLRRLGRAVREQLRDSALGGTHRYSRVKRASPS